MTQHTDAQTCHTCGGTHDNHKGSVHTCRCAGCDPQGEAELDKIVDFLCGKSELDGMWFGETRKDRPVFWWRKRLREAVATQREQVKQDLLKKGGSRFSELVREQARQEVLDEVESMVTDLELHHQTDIEILADVLSVINAKRKKGAHGSGE